MKEKLKILITVEDGIVQSICTSGGPEVIEIIVVDYDDKGDEPVLISGILEPDIICDPSKKVYEQVFEGKLHSSEKTAKKELKRLGF